jgi:hypothetical protein
VTQQGSSWKTDDGKMVAFPWGKMLPEPWQPPFEKIAGDRAHGDMSIEHHRKSGAQKETRHPPHPPRPASIESTCAPCVARSCTLCVLVCFPVSFLLSFSYLDEFCHKVALGIGRPYELWPANAAAQLKQDTATEQRHKEKSTKWQKDLDASQEEIGRLSFWNEAERRQRWWQYLRTDFVVSQPLLLLRVHLYEVRALMATLTNVSHGAPDRRHDEEILDNLFAFVERALPVLQRKHMLIDASELKAKGFSAHDKHGRALRDKMLLEHCVHACVTAAANVVSDGLAKHRDEEPHKSRSITGVNSSACLSNCVIPLRAPSVR